MEASGISPGQRFEINLGTVGLMSREKEIVRLVRRGRTYKHIADVLYISERTLSNAVVKSGQDIETAEPFDQLEIMMIEQNFNSPDDHARHG